MPWEGSGGYLPGPGMVEILGKWVYPGLRPFMAICLLNPPGNLAIVSFIRTINDWEKWARERSLAAMGSRVNGLEGIGTNG